MNKTEHIFGILGIRKDRDFYIGSNKDTIYRYTDEGLFCSDKTVDPALILYTLIMMADYMEVYEVSSEPWRPEIGEFYWSLNSLGQPVRNENRNSAFDICMFNIGNAFKTEAEAKNNGGKVDE